MKLYDEEVRLKTKVTKSCSGEVDEEGWQVVRRGRPDSLNREKALLSRMRVKEERRNGSKETSHMCTSTECEMRSWGSCDFCAKSLKRTSLRSHRCEWDANSSPCKIVTQSQSKSIKSQIVFYFP